jgi:uncharacterized membrane protein
MVIHELLHRLLAGLHALAGAAWFGSMFYSLFVMMPGTRRHFRAPAEREGLLLTLAHGARWQVVAAMAVVGLSGAGLAVSRSSLDAPPGLWWPALAAKVGLFVLAAALFWRISWSWWPARLFALEAELPGFDRQFRRGAMTMLVLVGLNALLGVIAHR